LIIAAVAKESKKQCLSGVCSYFNLGKIIHIPLNKKPLPPEQQATAND